MESRLPSFKFLNIPISWSEYKRSCLYLLETEGAIYALNIYERPESASEKLSRLKQEAKRLRKEIVEHRKRAEREAQPPLTGEENPLASALLPEALRQAERLQELLSRLAVPSEPIMTAAEAREHKPKAV